MSLKTSDLGYIIGWFLGRLFFGSIVLGVYLLGLAILGWIGYYMGYSFLILLKWVLP